MARRIHANSSVTFLPFTFPFPALPLFLSFFRHRICPGCLAGQFAFPTVCPAKQRGKGDDKDGKGNGDEKGEKKEERLGD